MHNASRFAPLALAVYALAAALFVTPVLGDLGGDSAHYLMLARALVAGDGYVDTFLPGAPPHGHYPPGFPLLLAPVVAAFGAHAFVAVKAWGIVMLVAGGAAVFLLVRRKAGADRALMALIVVMSVPALVMDGGRIRSEAAQLPLMCLALLCCERARDGVGSWWPAMILAWLTCATRVAAVPLVVLPALFSLRPRSAASGTRTWPRQGLAGAGWLVVGLAPIAAWATWSQAVGGGGSQGYVVETARSTAMSGGLTESVRWILDGLWFHGTGAAQFLGDTPVDRVTDLLAWLLTPAWLIGLGWRLRSGVRPTEVFFVLELLLIAFVPWRESRYLMPLLPLIALYLLDGVALIARRWSHVRVVPATTAALALAHLASLLPIVQARFGSRLVYAPITAAGPRPPVDVAHWEDGWVARRDDGGSALVQATGSLLLLLDQLRVELPADAVVASRLHRAVALLTGRKSVPLPAGDDPLRALAASGATCLLDDGRMPDTRRFVARLGPMVPLTRIAAVRGAVCWAVPRAQPDGKAAASPGR